MNAVGVDNAVWCSCVAYFAMKKLNQEIMFSEYQYQIIQPLVLSARIFGLCPIVFAKIGKFYEAKYSKVLVLYSYTIVVSIGIGTILGVHADATCGTCTIRMRKNKTLFISACDIAIVIIIALYGILAIPYRMRTFIKLLDIWTKIDNVIPISNHQKYRKKSIVFLLTTLLNFTALFLFDIIFYCFPKGITITMRGMVDRSIFYLKKYTTYYLLYYIIVFQEIFYWHLISYIHIRMSSLNRNLRKEKQAISCLFRKIFTIRQKSTIIVNKIELKSNESLKFERNIADRMIELLTVYGRIRESVEIVNSTASYGVVLLILSCLLHLIVTPYFLLIEIIKARSNMFIGLQALWLAAHIGRLLIMVEPCQKCLNEV
ncbi:gustatory receptor for sugar taste 43a [Sitophilus oryzae]|uniref:Gustatory receptor n=1 Tax=Sitophilus oryzae TaxID=7048 RepID=A0A6J2Y7M4_SITOR|nr:gustatory receptor for sugar taste 43a [Sitophilus oryzae]